MSQVKNNKYWLVVFLLLLWACSSQPEPGTVDDLENNKQGELDPASDAVVADVISVQVTGNPNAYQFSVEIASPDQGCQQYADWWEVLTEEGQLVYRRILTHSHVNEQPFTRSGGPVAIEADMIVIVRAHMHPGGYGGKALMGTVQSGFEEVELAPDLAADVESEPPLPTGCAF
jgi:hypothetical protein